MLSSAWARGVCRLGSAGKGDRERDPADARRRGAGGRPVVAVSARDKDAVANAKAKGRSWRHLVAGGVAVASLRAGELGNPGPEHDVEEAQ